jgi:hypothetical protein
VSERAPKSSVPGMMLDELLPDEPEEPDDKRAKAAEPEAAGAAPAPADEAAAPSVVPGRSSIPSDPRLASVEPLLQRGDWARICEVLGPPERAAQLPPTLGLLFAIARKEVAGEASAGDADALAIRSVAAVLGVGVASETALVVAKRALRRNPSTWRTVPAPKAGTSILFILVALAIGAAIGIMGPLHWRFF